MKIRPISWLFYLVVILMISGCATSNTIQSEDEEGDPGNFISGDGEDNNTLTLSETKIEVKGVLDGKSIVNKNLMSDVSKSFSYGSETVDGVIAVSDDGNTFVKATLVDNQFSLILDKNKTYLIVYLNGAKIVGVHRVDENTDLDIFPITEDSTNIDLGNVELGSSDRVFGSAPATEVFSELGITEEKARALGISDNGFMRFSSIDIDGNGLFDYEEGKYFDLEVDFEFSTNSSFENLQNDFSNPDLITFKGFMYYFFAHRFGRDLDWDKAILVFPEKVNGLDSIDQCYNISEHSSRVLNFLCGGGGYDPYTPPVGSYIVSLDDMDLTFSNVKTQTIDHDLTNVLIPSARIDVDENQRITNIDWQWWIRLEDGLLVKASDEEIQSRIKNAGYELGMSSWQGGTYNRVRGNIDLTSFGSVVPSDQHFIPGVMRISITDIAGFSYGFEWK